MAAFFSSYAQKMIFQKNIDKLAKKLKNKKVVVYGVGSYFECVYNSFDLSGLNIIGVSDKKFSIEQEGEKFLDYKIIPKEKMLEYKPDCIVVGTEIYKSLIRNLKISLPNKTKIKVLPLQAQTLIQRIKIIWDEL